jgi:DNA-binding MarR family transcriptional regulator
MWVNVMRHIERRGIHLDELHARARTTHRSLAGLQRWGYVTVEEGVVRRTKAGSEVSEVWAPMAGTVEERWNRRFGTEPVRVLRAALEVVVSSAGSGLALPDYLPIVAPNNNGKFQAMDVESVHLHEGEDRPLDISALLARALLAFTVDVERESRLSLPISANTLRVLDGHGVRLRDIPRLTGLSKEGNAMALGFLTRRDCVVIEDDRSSARGKVARLTPKGLRAQEKAHRVLAATEAGWSARFDVSGLRQALEPIVVGSDGGPSPLFRGLEPYPDGWRASVRRPEILPHYPMVLHRGGYPDGS